MGEGFGSRNLALAAEPLSGRGMSGARHRARFSVELPPRADVSVQAHAAVQ